MSARQIEPIFNEKEVYLIHKMLETARNDLIENVCFSEEVKKRDCGGCGLWRYCRLLIALSRMVNEYAGTKANSTFNDRRRIENTLRERIEEMRSDF